MMERAPPPISVAVVLCAIVVVHVAQLGQPGRAPPDTIADRRTSGLALDRTVAQAVRELVVARDAAAADLARAKLQELRTGRGHRDRDVCKLPRQSRR